MLLPWMWWCLGYPDRALEAGRAALAMFRRHQREFQVAMDVPALFNFVLFPRQLRREVEEVERGLEATRPFIEDQRCSANWLAALRMYEGWVHAQRGLPEQGIAEMRQATNDVSRYCLPLRPQYLGLIAEACARAAYTEEGLATVKEALEYVERDGARWNEAELRRIQGELLLQRGADPEEVESCFRQAIAVAQSQGAKPWELPATTSLARMLRDQGRTAEARDILSAIYAWFTEGFDTPDLLEARELLGQLAQ